MLLRDRLMNVYKFCTKLTKEYSLQLLNTERKINLTKLKSKKVLMTFVINFIFYNECLICARIFWERGEKEIKSNTTHSILIMLGN